MIAPQDIGNVICEEYDIMYCEDREEMCKWLSFSVLKSYKKFYTFRRNFRVAYSSQSSKEYAIKF